jgi:hypothetical protein
MAQAVITWDPPNKMGKITIHLIGQGINVNAVTESISTVVCEIGALVAAKRHCVALPPKGGARTVYTCIAKMRWVRPNLPAMAGFWVLQFVDGSQLRAQHPLAQGL